MSNDLSPQSPAEKNPDTRPLRRGDLVRVSQSGLQKAKRLKDREGHLGRISKISTPDDEGTSSSEDVVFDVEWVLGGRLLGCIRSDLAWTCAELEGMTNTSTNRRDKRKPVSFMEETLDKDIAKKQRKEAKAAANVVAVDTATKHKSAIKKSASLKRKPAAKNVKPKASEKRAPKRGVLGSASTITATKGGKKLKVEECVVEPTERVDLYEKHRREFERCFVRLEDKVDCFRHFSEEVPDPFVERYIQEQPEIPFESAAAGEDNNSSFSLSTPSSSVYPPHAPYNWEMIRRRMHNGRYVLNRTKNAEDERLELLGPYFQSLGKKRYRRNKKVDNTRMLYPEGVDWQLFQADVIAMCNGAVARQSPDDRNDEDGQRGTLAYSVKKVKEALQQTAERTGSRHATELAHADDRHKFALAVKASNTEAAMQSWRKTPFPERKYERIKSDVVCAGLSHLDKKIAAFELQTNLPDSFVGQSYRYNDTGQSEAWMKSVVDETGSSNCKSRKRNSSVQKADDERLAALALAADDGVTRAQVSATMQSLLIEVQDKVMTEANVLRQAELRSANWIAADIDVRKDLSLPIVANASEASDDREESRIADKYTNPQSYVPDNMPEIVEQPVWGIDCYTRQNILNCLEIEFDPRTALKFVEKWLLPAINACPEELAHNISNAARILEGLPFEQTSGDESEETAKANDPVSFEPTNASLVLQSLMKKIETCSPPWLKAAANQLRRARAALGPDFFRVHPKGHGSVVLSPTLKANALVTFYHGELYPSWRWGEKMDAIEITQKRKHLKPNLPDFYNMALERPQRDPRGYGLLFVDASRKAGHGSSLSHSCTPTCEVRVAAFNGELCLAMTTLRELEMGEELTFDYNAVTESLNEYRSAVCLCGCGGCRGSFLHFATADCYQQVLNRNSPIATRFANLIKGSMKRVMSPDDEQVLKNHGFLTAAFGAISVNRRVVNNDGEDSSLIDTLDMAPVWLRTFVADVLRYIEYERRALPIALICEHLSSSQKDVSKSSAVVLAKEPKQEPTFFYFSRTQSDFILSTLKSQGFPENLSGLQMKHTIQKVASSYWGALSEEKKTVWKNEARLDFEKKLKAWRADKKKRPVVEVKKERVKPEIEDILHSSKISFQDADAEGVVAMEQRIQQLTQTLSRIGRVLDRHREASFELTPDSEEPSESAEARVLAPIRVLRDDEVVDWMWNKFDGVWFSLVRSLENARCVRPQLVRVINDVRQKYDNLEGFGDPQKKDSKDTEVVDGRRLLTAALLEARSVLLRELKEMSREFREVRVHPLTLVMDETRSQVSPPTHSDEESVGQNQNVSPDSATDPSITKLESAKSCMPSNILSIATPHVVTSLLADPATETDDAQLNVTKVYEEEILTINDGQWMEFYNERFTLHAAADLLLMYARTSNFFVLQPYRPLQSTPVEVYARELGNVVPRSVIDNDLSISYTACLNPDFERTPEKVDPHPNKLNKGQRRRSLDVSTSPSEGKRNPAEFCSPDEVVAKVTVQYQGDYVLSQLLQWYNAGIGHKPGLPDLLGCTLLPRIADCFTSDLQRTSKLKADRKTAYEVKIRPRLIDWLQDPYQRGNPWPNEIRKAFLCDAMYWPDQDASSAFLPFGTPVIDFLVTGDESNIDDVLRELDVDDKVVTKAAADGLLSSIDKGRPAQAVSTWVQCEHPHCMKWRKIPWYVDADLLPSEFFCEDNIWNPSCSNCEAPEDDWDKKDALVDNDGKVEGTPVKKVADEMLSVSEESSFTIGNRFDVKRSDKAVYSVASVTKVDFSGTIKRIMFHFSKTSSDRDEWVELGSPRIAPLYSMVSKKGVAKVDKSRQLFAQDGKKLSAKSKMSNASSNGMNTHGLQRYTDPSNEKSFFIGARFDVYRYQCKKHCFAVVKEVEFTYDRNRILFHYAKTKDKFDEWIEFGSPRISAFKSKVFSAQKEKQLKSAEKVSSIEEKQIDVATSTVPRASLCEEQQDKLSMSTTNDEPDESLPLVSEASETNENQHCDATSLTTCEHIESPASDVAESVSFEQSSDLCQDSRASQDVVVKPVHANELKASDGLVSHLNDGNFSFSKGYEGDFEPNNCFPCGSDRNCSGIGYEGGFEPNDCFSRAEDKRYMSHSYESLASMSGLKPRPPDFVTSTERPALDFLTHDDSRSVVENQRFWSSTAAPDSSIDSPATSWSGLDILAAVTHQHELGSSHNKTRLDACTTNVPSTSTHGFGHAPPLQSDQASLSFGRQQPSVGQFPMTKHPHFSGNHYGWY